MTRDGRQREGYEAQSDVQTLRPSVPRSRTLGDFAGSGSIHILDEGLGNAISRVG